MLAAASATPFAGKLLIDGLGPSRTVAVLSVPFGLAVFSMGRTQNAVALAGSIAAMRLFGANLVPTATAKAAASWFHPGSRTFARVGLLLVASMYVMNAIPMGVSPLIEEVGWRKAYSVCGVVGGVGLLLVAGGLLRDGPLIGPSCVDVESEHYTSTTSAVRQKSFTLREALSTARFWAFLMSICCSEFLWTGMHFNLIGVLGSHSKIGAEKHQLLEILLVVSVAAPVASFATSVALQRSSSVPPEILVDGSAPGGKTATTVPDHPRGAAGPLSSAMVVLFPRERCYYKLALSQMCCVVIGAIFLLLALHHHDAPAARNGLLLFFGAFFAAAMGIQDMFMMTLWADIFGSQELGTISGVALAFITVCTGAGPLIFGEAAHEQYTGERRHGAGRGKSSVVLERILCVVLVWAGIVGVGLVWVKKQRESVVAKEKETVALQEREAEFVGKVLLFRRRAVRVCKRNEMFVDLFLLSNKMRLH